MHTWVSVNSSDTFTLHFQVLKHYHFPEVIKILNDLKNLLFICFYLSLSLFKNIWVAVVFLYNFVIIMFWQLYNALCKYSPPWNFATWTIQALHPFFSPIEKVLIIQLWNIFYSEIVVFSIREDISEFVLRFYKVPWIQCHLLVSRALKISGKKSYQLLLLIRQVYLVPC